MTSLLRRMRSLVGEIDVDLDEAIPFECHAVQQSDEMFCARCNLRWDVNDPEPPRCRRTT